MKIGVIADIHGNAPALEAVLEELPRHEVDLVVQLGDAFNGPIDPVGVARLLRAVPIAHVRGNGERMILAEDAAERSASATFARERLSADDLEWIESWPRVHREAGLLACHGSPRSDVEYLLEHLQAGGGVTRRRPAEVAEILGADRAGLVLCGHTHVPGMVRVDARCTVVNPGSVGLPAYADTVPVSHKMEVGSPEARYAVVELGGEDGLRVTQFTVPYAVERAAHRAEQFGFDDWAWTLRTGFAR
ncbi:metallophosphoesterase family protein [Actomonas aquatica]|uniref:Metallophosphoesterase family protein n=1 Tax=Actomonas aquatica TaxID=2866162 RepID=A0ABZ1C4S8_9BACT|nr:metallophosphoesterase family protein [Opitutus sp. WL0086]WRQ86328.1 metallophosphoesterase family protein [Opitutus sp. WL0086]